ncbi:MAG: hypothetical protein ABIO02_05150 [Patescibacteria group bacterium]
MSVYTEMPSIFIPKEHLPEMSDLVQKRLFDKKAHSCVTLSRNSYLEHRATILEDDTGLLTLGIRLHLAYANTDQPTTTDQFAFELYNYRSERMEYLNISQMANGKSVYYCQYPFEDLDYQAYFRRHVFPANSFDSVGNTGKDQPIEKTFTLRNKLKSLMLIRHVLKYGTTDNLPMDGFIESKKSTPQREESGSLLEAHIPRSKAAVSYFLSDIKL